MISFSWDSPGGAFAMRFLADFIMKNGILPKAELNYLPEKFLAWKAPHAGDTETHEGGNDGPLEEAPHWKKVMIKACALWDTVPTMGLKNPISGGRYGFVDSESHPNVEQAFQALSLHEHRCQLLPVGFGAHQGEPKHFKAVLVRWIPWRCRRR